jgi:hypothetical protein
MNARFLMIAVAALSAAPAIAADREQQVRDMAQAQPAQPRLLLASAEEVRTPAPAEQQAPAQPKPRRIARVTTCRCGDPQPQPDAQQ